MRAPASRTALLCCCLCLLSLILGADAARTHESSFSLSPRLAFLMPSLGGKATAATASNTKTVQLAATAGEAEVAVLPRAAAHMRRLKRWAGVLWQRARVSVVSTVPEKAWRHMLAWFRQARHRIAAVLVQLAKRYDLNFEYAEDWMAEEDEADETHYGGRQETEHTEAIEHIGYSHRGNPVVLVEIRGNWEPYMADTLNRTLCDMFEQHDEVCVLVHVSSTSALTSLPTTTINNIVAGLLRTHPGKRLNAFITPNPGRAVTWAFFQTHRRIDGLKLKFVHPHDLEKLVEPHILPESLRLVTA